MELADYLRRFDADGRATFAVSVGTTLGHLNNVAYKQRIASAALAREIAENSGGMVPVWHSRPDDWHRIWPELIGSPGAPCIPPMADAAQRQAA